MTNGLDLLREDAPAPPPPARRRGRSAVVVLVALLVVGLVVLGAGLVISRSINRSPGDWSGTGSGSVKVTVHSGDTAAAIGQTLVAAEVVRTSSAFYRVAAADDRSRSIQPGVYDMRHHMSSQAALERLLDPKARVGGTVTIPEGSTVEQSLALIAKDSDIPLAELQRAVLQPATYHLSAICRGKPEGCLFPATYVVADQQGATGVLTAMATRFGQAADDVDLVAGAANLHHSAYDVLKVASIVEKEAKVPADYPKVAAVVYNRLDKGIRLQLDSTIAYAIKANRVWLTSADLSTNSAYNLYLHDGLPPTPICNPGEAALKAALHPADGDWLYFITMDKSGKNAFTSDYTEFLQLKAQAKKNFGIK